MRLEYLASAFLNEFHPTNLRHEGQVVMRIVAHHNTAGEDRHDAAQPQSLRKEVGTVREQAHRTKLQGRRFLE